MSVSPDSYLISKAADRWNGIAFGTATLMSYLAAPVLYIGMVQAALCARLGGNATVANLPTTVSALTGVVPLFASWLIPYRYERSVVTWCALLSAAILAATGCGLVAPVSNLLRIFLVVGCSLWVYMLTCVQQVYLYQCLSRGTTERGRARTLQITFTLGPMAAVAGSLGAQALLDGRWLGLGFPANFAAVYLLSVPCLLIIAIAGRRQRVVEVKEVERPLLSVYLSGSLRHLVQSRTLLLLAAAYALTCSAVACEPNLTLYVRSALGRPPEVLVGYIMAVRFAGKSAGGLLLGWIAQRWSSRAALMAVTVVIVAGSFWALLVTGVPYFLCFALLGTGELAGAYFPNYCLSASTVETGARNLAILSIFASLAGVGAAVHGLLADIWGYPASIAAAGLMAAAALFLIGRMRPAVCNRGLTFKRRRA